MRLSIILPVYNVAKFIPDCLDSLLCQDIPKEDYEIICVNDGSPDSSAEVIEGYAKLHSNIKIISQPNSGVCAARNTGFENAKGKYVWFIDPDDYVVPNCLGALLSAMEEKGADLSVFGYKCVLEEAKPNLDESIDINFSLQEEFSSTGAVWQYICKKQYLIDNRIYLNKDLAYGEDYLWAFQINYRKHVGLETKSEIYCYRQRQGSAMRLRSEEKKRRHQRDLLALAKIYEDEYVRCKNEGFDKKVLKNVRQRQVLCVQSVILDLVKISKDKQEVKVTLAKLKQEGLYPYKMPWWQLRDKNLAGGFKNKLFCLFFPFKWYVKLMAKIFRKKAKK